MGSVQNTLRVGVHDGQPVALGLFPVGDACCHTNPTFALGLSMSLLHPAELVRVLAEHPDDPCDQALAYWAAILPEARERYELALSTDAARQRVWRGERLDPSKRTGCFPLFMQVATGVAAMRDAEIFRRTVRRTGFLDRTAAFDDDVALQERVERLFADARAAGPPPPPGPPRAELLDLLAKSTRQG
jgi:2-polyprenyl-6-methoxyphenol hydroxylase-like FAD-dependent oxidoreductase